MPRVRMGALLCLGVLGACLEAPHYACMTDAECMLNNVQGRCDLASSTCLYMTPACPSGWRDGHGTCAVPTTPLTTSTTDDTSVSDGQNEEDSSSSDGSSGEGSWGTTYTPVVCEMGSGEITSMGGVSATSENTELMYTAEQVMDGDFTTSWFSTGPEPAGMPTVFRWSSSERCITGVEIEGNAMHPDRSEGWGFESVTVEVLDVQSETIFQQTFQLTGTPDPHVSVMTGGVVGDRVLLNFSGHENSLGGGFSELNVFGQ